MSATNLAYTSFLLRVAHSGSFPEMVSALLPCYWVCMYMGKLLSRVGSPVEEYRRWIFTYGGEEYEKSVKWVINTLDRFEVTKHQGEAMLNCFRTATIYEYLFFDSAMRKERFPFPVSPR